ncbi:uncharacterized protein [Palaemon carinicauda]|uniref:uncharacterized protein isoform X1 n=1 Tax=Palaemon carinicauda TaxID=392227 RepID=UPI0035B64EF9
MALNMDSFEFECCNSLQFIRISISPGSLKVSQNRGCPGTDASQLVFVLHPPRGHVGVSGNEEVDELAEEASEKLLPRRYLLHLPAPVSHRKKRFYIRHGKKLFLYRC